MAEVTFRGPLASDEPQLVYAQEVMARENFAFAFDFTRWANFALWLLKVEEQQQGKNLQSWQVPGTFELALVGEQVAGRLSVRHRLNDQLMNKGGHIGYGVLPEFRHQGVGKALMRRGLEIAASLGIARALVTCDDDNVPSRRIIEGAGGILESLYVAKEGDVPTRRYWIG
jgi:predicted acetyltransferase